MILTWSVSWKRRVDSILLCFIVSDIYVFAIGAEIYDDDLLRLTTGNGGPHYFRLNDVDKKLNQTFDEMIGKARRLVKSLKVKYPLPSPMFPHIEA